MPIGNQREWPPVRESNGTERNSPTGYFLKNEVILRSDRAVAGALRLGTEPRVGPRGLVRNGSSDYGMDRITPREMDPMGTSATRAPQVREPSTLVSREIRRGRNRGD